MDFDISSINDKHIQRLKEFLLAKGWSEKEIFELIDYLTK